MNSVEEKNEVFMRVQLKELGGMGGIQMAMGLCPDELNREQQSLLRSGAEELIEMIRDDMRSVRLGKEFSHTNMPCYLPPQFSRHYCIPFMKRLLDTAIVVE